MSRSAWSIVAGVVLCAGTGLFADEAVDQSNVFGLPYGAVQAGGALVIAGGGQPPDEVYDEFVRLAGGELAELVLIPSAYPYDDEDHIASAFGGWKEYDVVSFAFLHTDNAKVADTKRFCAALEKATGVWIAGGAQGRLVDRYGGTRVEKLLREVVKRGGVVGGTSAGASVQSKLMIRYGSATDAVLDDGFSLTTRLVIDQHFSERGRFPRLLGVLEEHPGHIGLGVDEDTAVIVQGNRLRIIGEGKATVCFGPVAAGEGTVVHRLSHDEHADVAVRPRLNELSYQLTRLVAGGAKK